MNYVCNLSFEGLESAKVVTFDENFNFNIRKIRCKGLLFPIFDSCNRCLFSLFETIWNITEFNKYKTIDFFCENFIMFDHGVKKQQLEWLEVKNLINLECSHSLVHKILSSSVPSYLLQRAFQSIYEYISFGYG